MTAEKKIMRLKFCLSFFFLSHLSYTMRSAETVVCPGPNGMVGKKIWS